MLLLLLLSLLMHVINTKFQKSSFYRKHHLAVRLNILCQDQEICGGVKLGFFDLFSLFSRPNCNHEPETSRCLENCSKGWSHCQRKLSVTNSQIHPCCNLVGVTQSQLIVWSRSGCWMRFRGIENSWRSLIWEAFFFPDASFSCSKILL